MDPIITTQTLQAVGIHVNPEDEAALLDHLNDTLQERIGVEVTSSLDDTQLDALVELQERNDDQAVQQWLVENVPELNDIVKDEIDILLGEIAENTDGINRTA